MYVIVWLFMPVCVSVRAFGCVHAYGVPAVVYMCGARCVLLLLCLRGVLCLVVSVFACVRLCV